jgi:hypothetical protein
MTLKKGMKVKVQNNFGIWEGLVKIILPNKNGPKQIGIMINGNITYYNESDILSISLCQ